MAFRKNQLLFKCVFLRVRFKNNLPTVEYLWKLLSDKSIVGEVRMSINRFRCSRGLKIASNSDYFFSFPLQANPTLMTHFIARAIIFLSSVDYLFIILPLWCHSTLISVNKYGFFRSYNFSKCTWIRNENILWDS